MKKQKFSIKQHQAAGKGLKTIYSFLVSLVVMIKNAYPKNSNVVRLADNLLAGCLALRVELDDQVCIENPNSPNREVIRCYFEPGMCCKSSCGQPDNDVMTKLRKKYDPYFVCPKSV